MAAVALVSPLLIGRQWTLAASSLPSGLRLSVRGLKGQSVIPGPHSPGKSCPPVEAKTDRVVTNRGQVSTLVRHFIGGPTLAQSVASRLTGGRNFKESRTFLEFEPGPGVLTRKLLNAGARIIALESNKSFLPNLESLKKEFENQLEVVHGNFIKLDARPNELLKESTLCSETLFKNLGIFEVPWTADIPLKVVGILPKKEERIFIWRLTYFLYECSSIYNYGRIELNLFVTERMYKVFVAKPPDKRLYQSLSVLWQTACDIHLLHKEPYSSFATNSKNSCSIPKSANEHLYLVRLTPRKDLFTDFLTTANSKTFITMVKQCFAKSTSMLLKKLNLWSFENAENLLRELEIPENAAAGGLYPEAYKSLFEFMEQSNQIDQSLFYDVDLLIDDRKEF